MNPNYAIVKYFHCHSQSLNMRFQQQLSVILTVNDIDFQILDYHCQLDVGLVDLKM